MISRVKPLLKRNQRMQISARVTVAPQNLDVRNTLEGLLELGFHSIRFSPTLSSLDSAGEMSPAGLEIMLARMIACRRAFQKHVEAGVVIPSSIQAVSACRRTSFRSDVIVSASRTSSGMPWLLASQGAGHQQVQRTLVLEYVAFRTRFKRRLIISNI